MLDRFLNECKLINSDSEECYKNVYNKLTNKKIFNTFMPLRSIDLFQVNIIQEDASFINDNDLINVYFVSLGQNNYMGVTHMEDILLEYFDSGNISSDLTNYDIKLKDTILLSHPLFYKSFDLKEYGMPNIIYQSYVLSNGKEAHVFYFASDELFLYKNIIENYHINIDILVDYKFGIGNYNQQNELYKYFNNTSFKYLSPKYYLKEYVEFQKIDGDLIFRKYYNNCAIEIYKL